jgi:hypothetical protein
MASGPRREWSHGPKACTQRVPDWPVPPGSIAERQPRRQGDDEQQDEADEQDAEYREKHRSAALAAGTRDGAGRPRFAGQCHPTATTLRLAGQCHPTSLLCNPAEQVVWHLAIDGPAVVVERPPLADSVPGGDVAEFRHDLEQLLDKHRH